MAILVNVNSWQVGRPYLSVSAFWVAILVNINGGPYLSTLTIDMLSYVRQPYFVYITHWQVWQPYLSVSTVDSLGSNTCRRFRPISVKLNEDIAYHGIMQAITFLSQMLLRRHFSSDLRQTLWEHCLPQHNASYTFLVHRLIFKKVGGTVKF